MGGDVLLTLCAIAGGSCFGDNIGMISDVTVLSCGMQDVKIIDRIKHQMAWCFGCLAIALVVFYFAMACIVYGVEMGLAKQHTTERLEVLRKKRAIRLLMKEKKKGSEA